MNITEHDIYSETNRLAFLATTAIERAMKRLGLKRSEVAERLGVPRSRVTKVLDGETNLTLKTLASFGLVCGVRWHFGAVGIADGTVALNWPNFEFSTAPGAQMAGQPTADYCPSGAEAAKRVPEHCSALRASQDPLGPL